MMLFEPITIRGMRLKNRIIFPAMGIMGHDLGTDRTASLVAFWAELARGGAGAIVLGGVAPASLIREEALTQPVPPAQYIEGLSQLAEAVHRESGALGIQLCFGGQSPSELTIPWIRGQEWVAASARLYKGTEHPLPYMPAGVDIPMRELTIAEIEAKVQRIGRAAAAVRDTGADFVEIHMAHNHLMNQFTSPLTNHRRDRYGGDLAGRTRFGLECVGAMRAAVGSSYPIFVRFPAQDEAGQGGMTLEEGCTFARELEAAGADCLDVTIGVPFRTAYANFICPTGKSPMGTYAPLAGAIRKTVSIPVVAVGRINTAWTAEDILQREQADLVAIGRQLLCDPEWPQKALQGREEEVVACDSCNTFCWGIGPQGKPPASLCRKRQIAS